MLMDSRIHWVEQPLRTRETNPFQTSEKKPGRTRGRENVRVRYIYFFYVLFYFIVILNVPFWAFLSPEPMCQRKILIFMLCILMNNKDLFIYYLFIPVRLACLKRLLGPSKFWGNDYVPVNIGFSIRRLRTLKLRKRRWPQKNQLFEYQWNILNEEQERKISIQQLRILKFPPRWLTTKQSAVKY